MSFIGRQRELAQLKRLTNKKVASLVCVLGRRRIGKSTLIEKFGESFPRFIEIQGLGPDLRSTLADQLENFAEKLSEQTNQRKQRFDNWQEAFTALANATKKGKVLILLDEISWMAKGDKLFSAKLKAAWDTQLKKNPSLILVLCGSVSSWIEDNLLKQANFEGRISLQINLKELSLSEINLFWKQQKSNLSPLEKLLILSVTGGVPKYLEEFLPGKSAEKELLQLCFNESGIFYNDFEKIFTEIFGRRAETLEKIVRVCLEKKHTSTTLAKALKVGITGQLINNLEVLELSGFLNRDYYFNPDGKASKLNHLRVSDNYLRFYLKYIEPVKAKISKGAKRYASVNELPNFEGMLGLQFENVVLWNRKRIVELLDIEDAQLHSAAPFVQRKKADNKGGCQIDLLIHTTLDIFYLCEIKCQKRITRSVLKEVEKKLSLLTLPKRSAVKPVLIYMGEIEPDHETELNDFFYKMISWEEMVAPLA